MAKRPKSRNFLEAGETINRASKYSKERFNADVSAIEQLFGDVVQLQDVTRNYIVERIALQYKQGRELGLSDWWIADKFIPDIAPGILPEGTSVSNVNDAENLLIRSYLPLMASRTALAKGNKIMDIAAEMTIAIKDTIRSYDPEKTVDASITFTTRVNDAVRKFTRMDRDKNTAAVSNDYMDEVYQVDADGNTTNIATGDVYRAGKPEYTYSALARFMAQGDRSFPTDWVVPIGESLISQGQINPLAQKLGSRNQSELLSFGLKQYELVPEDALQLSKLIESGYANKTITPLQKLVARSLRTVAETYAHFNYNNDEQVLNAFTDLEDQYGRDGDINVKNYGDKTKPVGLYDVVNNKAILSMSADEAIANAGKLTNMLAEQRRQQFIAKNENYVFPTSEFKSIFDSIKHFYPNFTLEHDYDFNPIDHGIPGVKPGRVAFGPEENNNDAGLGGPQLSGWGVSDINEMVRKYQEQGVPQNVLNAYRYRMSGPFAEQDKLSQTGEPIDAGGLIGEGLNVGLIPEITKGYEIRTNLDKDDLRIKFDQKPWNRTNVAMKAQGYLRLGFGSEPVNEYKKTALDMIKRGENSGLMPTLNKLFVPNEIGDLTGLFVAYIPSGVGNYNTVIGLTQQMAEMVSLRETEMAHYQAVNHTVKGFDAYFKKAYPEVDAAYKQANAMERAKIDQLVNDLKVKYGEGDIQSNALRDKIVGESVAAGMMPGYEPVVPMPEVPIFLTQEEIQTEERANWQPNKKKTPTLWSDHPSEDVPLSGAGASIPIEGKAVTELAGVTLPESWKVVYGPTGKTQADGSKVAAITQHGKKTITLDLERIEELYDQKAWMRPGKPGVVAFKETAFRTLQEYVDFVGLHEIAHIDPKVRGLNGAARENAANAKAWKDLRSNEVDYLPSGGNMDDPVDDDMLIQNHYNNTYDVPNIPDANRQANIPRPRRSTFGQDVGDILAGPYAGLGIIEYPGMPAMNLRDMNKQISMPHIGELSFTQMNGRVASAEFTNAITGEITPDDTVRRGLGMAQNAVRSAFAKTDLMSMNEPDVATNVAASASKLLQKAVKDMTDDAIKSGNPNAIQDAKDVASIAYRGVTNLTGKISELSGMNTGEANAYKHMASPVFNQNHLEALAGRDPYVAGLVAEAGGINNMFRGPNRIFSSNGETYQVGEGSLGFGQRTKSIYQTDFGRLMMAGMMVSGSVSQSLTAFEKSITDYEKTEGQFLALDSFGGGEISSAAMATSRRETFATRKNEIAYQKYSGISEMGQLLGGGAGGDFALAAGLSLKTGFTAGVTAAGAAYMGSVAIGGATGAALAASVLPIALGVGGVVAAGGLAVDAINYSRGQTPDEGVSWKNASRAAAMGQIEASYQGKENDPFDAIRQSGKYGRFTDLFGNPNNNALFRPEMQGSVIDEIISELAPEQSQYEFFRSYGFSSSQAVSLAGSSYGNANARDLAAKIKDSTGLLDADVSKGLSQLEPFVGSYDDANNRVTAFKMFENQKDFGRTIADQVQGVAGIAANRGALPGTQEWARIAREYTAMGEEGGYSAQAAQDILTQKQAQIQSQYQYYMPGGAKQASSAFALGANSGLEAQLLTARIMAADTVGSDVGKVTTDNWARNIAGMTIAESTGVNSAALIGSQMGGGLTGTPRVDYNQFVYAAEAAVNKGVITGEQLQKLSQMDPYTTSRAAALVGNNELQSVDGYGRQQGMYNFEVASKILMPNHSELTTVQRLEALGIYKGDSAMQKILDEKGIVGGQIEHQQRMFGFQEAQIGLGFAKIASQERYMFGGAGGTGTGLAPARDSMWGIQDQQNAIQWQGQLASFAYSVKRMDTAHGFEEQNQQASEKRWGVNNEYNKWQSGFGYQTSIMQRGYAREDRQYQSQMSNLSYGFSLEDIDENIRRSSGRDRALLLKQRERLNLTHNLEEGQKDKEAERQEEMWKREDEQYQKKLENMKAMEKFDLEDFERARKQRDILFEMDKEDLERKIEEAKALHALETESLALQRQQNLDNIEFQKISLGIQWQQLEEQKNWQGALDGEKTVMDAISKSISEISNNAPAFLALLQGLNKLKVNADVGINITVTQDGKIIITGKID